jgi:hypothetical protein
MSTGSEEIVEITISKDGSGVKLNALGFSGKGCSIALNDLAKTLGSMTDFTKKTEYYNEVQEEVVIVNPIE